MNTDGVTAGGGGSTICTMAMLVCLPMCECVCVRVCEHECVHTTEISLERRTYPCPLLPLSVHPTQDCAISIPPAFFLSITDADSQDAGFQGR